MKKITFIWLLTLITFPAFCQNLHKALKSVEHYIKSKVDNPANYVRVKFGKCYEETNAAKIERYLKITSSIKYSLNLTYKVGDSLIDYNYFHLDKNYHVVGVSTAKEVMDILFFQMYDIPLDSSEILSTIKLKNDRSKKQITYQKDDFLFSYESDLFSQELSNRYLSGTYLFIGEHTFTPFVMTLKNYLDTCKSNSISLNDLSKSLDQKNASFISLIAQALIEIFLKNAHVAIRDLKTNTNIETMTETIKKIEFEKFTRIITTYQTVDKLKTITSFQSDRHDKNKK